MRDAVTRIQTMRDMFLYAQKLYAWCFTKEFELEYSNCPSADFFYNLFCLSPCKDAAADHFEAKDNPILLSDSMGFVWIAATEGSKIHMLGPIFTLEASESYLQKLCAQMKLSAPLISELLEQIKLVTVIPIQTALSYAIMLHYCVTGRQIQADAVAAYMAPSAVSEAQDWYSSTWHGTWQAEQEMLRRVQEGRMESAESMAATFSGGQVGNMSMGDPLRQAKNEALCFTVLVSRAAMQGGMSPEGGYNLADYYIQRAEACTRVSDVYHCATEMYETYLRRVHQCKESQKYSTAVAAMQEYIRTHIMEKISMDTMAQELGYTAYYLSSKFQKEVGQSLNSYIKQEKIALSKQMLRAKRLSFADISDRLGFSSPSYFSATFKQLTGMTPSEFQNQKG